MKNKFINHKKVKLNGKINYISSNGNYITKDGFDVGFEFENGKVLVANKNDYNSSIEGDNLIYNYLDSNGELISDKWYDSQDNLEDALSKELYVGDIFIGTKYFCCGLYGFINVDDVSIIDQLSDLEIYETNYFIKDKNGNINKGTCLLKFYRGDYEYIFSFDINDFLLDNDYISIEAIIEENDRLLTNYIVLDKNNKYFLTNQYGDIISEGYDDVNLLKEYEL